MKSVMESVDLIAEDYSILSYDFTVYLFDRRKNIPESYSHNEMVNDTVEAMRTLGLTTVSIFGVSQGGMIAMDIAINNPEIVEKMVLGSTSCLITDEQYRQINSWVELAKKKEPKELLLAFGKDIYPRNVYEDSKAAIVELAKTVTEKEMERFIILAESMQGFNVSNRLNEIKCPVLFMGDRTDSLFGRDAVEAICEGFKDKSDFQFYMYEGYGHSPYDLAPDYKHRLLDFFR